MTFFTIGLAILLAASIAAMFHEIATMKKRSPFDNGEYRRASETPRYRATDGAGDSPRWANPPARISHYRASFSAGKGARERARIEKRLTSIEMLPQQITVGELVGYRLWRITKLDGELWLRSIAAKVLWRPGVQVNGDLNAVVCRLLLRGPVFGGVFSYKSMDYLRGDVDPEDLHGRYSFRSKCGDLDDSLGGYIGLAIGTVHCWGEVVEHEYGYRAEHARLTSIDQVIGPYTRHYIRRKLQAKYLP